MLAGILAVGLGLRLWSIGHGLPYAYNPDEDLHFVRVAVGMFGDSFNPRYFDNPPGLTYLLYVVFKLVFLAGFPFGSSAPFVAGFAADPTPVFLAGRVTVALLGALVTALVYWAGARYYDGRVGLVAAALLAVAFLPVFYSKQALNDVVTLAPVTVALAACLWVWQRGAARDWALAGAAVGAAAAVKYTAGAMAAVVVLAALLRLLEHRTQWRRTVLGLVGAGATSVAAFLALNPYALLDRTRFLGQLGGQSGHAASAKLGQEDVWGGLYYLWTLTWGFGWLPLLAAGAGAVLALRADHRRAVLLIAFPVLLWLFLGGQGRFFGRWLLPAYPALAVLAGFATVRATDWLAARAASRQAGWRQALLVTATALLAAQGVVSSVHVDLVLARQDTRVEARDWLRRELPAGTKLAAEPVFPEDYLDGGAQAYRLYPVARPRQAYPLRLAPGLIEKYRRGGYCWVVTGSTQRGRALKAGLAGAAAYYRRLERSARQVAVFSPYRPGAARPGFNFDHSFDYYPMAYQRPGPEIIVYRLNDCR